MDNRARRQRLGSVLSTVIRPWRAPARRAWCLGFAILALVGPASRAFGQTPATARLQGVVTDQTGGVIVGAVVGLEGLTGARRSARTDRQGRYGFEALAPGTYLVVVQVAGFQDFAAPADVESGAVATFNVELKVSIAVTLDVQDRPGLSTDPRQNQSAMILTRKDIDALPSDPKLFMRRLLEMAGSRGRPGDVTVYVDGFSTFRRLPPKETIELIRINSNPFSAEFSQPNSKRIEITTKPGSDRYHGEARVQAHSDKLDSKNPLALDKSTQRSLNFSGYVQGPVRKGRLDFMLWAGEWHQDDNAFVRATVPDEVTGLPRLFQATIPTPTRARSVELKLDYLIFGQPISTSFGRTEETHREQGLGSGFDLPERAFDRVSTDNAARLWWTAVGRRSVNDVRAELTYSDAAATPRLASPAVFVFDAFHSGGNQNAGTRSSTYGLQFAEAFTIQLRKHVLKAGVQVESSAERRTDRSNFGGTFTFGADVERDAFGQPILDAGGTPISVSPLERYRRTILGLPGYGPSQFAIVRGNPEVEVTQWHVSSFLLDDWAISKRVSLSYGVRQEFQTNVKRRVNLGLRAGLSWLLDDDGENAVKVGAGMFHGRVDPGITFDATKLNGVGQRLLIVRNPGFFGTIPESVDLISPAESATYRTADDLRVPLVFLTSLTFERELPWGMFGFFEYRFEKGQHLLRLRNLATPGAAVPPVLQFESSGRSVRHELSAGLRGNISRQISLYGNYAFGRKRADTDDAYSTPADSFDLSSEYGLAADDVRHSVVAGASLQLPGGLLLYPSIAISSGQPFNITTGRDNNNDTLFNDRPAFADPGDPGAVQTPYGLFNANPGPGDVVIPRNFGREPRQVAVNLSVSKSLPKGIGLNIDVANLLNNRRLVGSNGVIASPSFGVPNRALEGRRFDFSIRYGF